MKRFSFLLVLLFLFAICLDSHAQTRKKVVSPIMLGADLGIGIPTGNFADAVNTGFGLNGVVSYFLQRNLLLTGNIGYWSFSKSEGGIDFSFSTIPLNLGLHYRFSEVGFIPFIGAETFLFFNSAKIEYLGYSSSDSETKFGFVPLVGFAYKLSQTMELRGALKYHIIFTEDENTTFLGILVGLHFPL